MHICYRAYLLWNDIILSISKKSLHEIKGTYFGTLTIWWGFWASLIICLMVYILSLLKSMIVCLCWYLLAYQHTCTCYMSCSCECEKWKVVPGYARHAKKLCKVGGYGDTLTPELGDHCKLEVSLRYIARLWLWLVNENKQKLWDSKNSPQCVFNHLSNIDLSAYPVPNFILDFEYIMR